MPDPGPGWHRLDMSFQGGLQPVRRGGELPVSIQ